MIWSMACDDRKFEKESDKKGVHCQKRNVGVYHIAKKKGLAIVELYCLMSWNRFYIQMDTC